MKIIILMLSVAFLSGCGASGQETREFISSRCLGKLTQTITISQFGSDTVVLYCDDIDKKNGV